MTLRVLSLFSGIGGIDLGLERAGMRVVAQVEREPFCLAVLARHWPHVPRFTDVRSFDAREWRGSVDVVAGGFPCQDISVAGKGAGLEGGTRSGLWYEMLRIVREARPEWVLAENVPALRTRGADTVFAGLEEAGYDVRSVVVGAWACGAPHKRDRVWIVARLGYPARAPGERDAGGFSAAQAGERREGELDGDFAVGPEPPASGGAARDLADPEGVGRPTEGQRWSAEISGAGSAPSPAALADADGGGAHEGSCLHARRGGSGQAEAVAGGADGVAYPECDDGESRREGEHLCALSAASREARGEGRECPAQPERGDRRCGTGGMADAPGVGCEPWRGDAGPEGGERERGRESARGPEAVADADGERREERHAPAESDQPLHAGRGSDPRFEPFPGFPAGPGCPQHEWEQPRLADAASGTPWLPGQPRHPADAGGSEREMGGAAHGLSGDLVRSSAGDHAEGRRGVEGTGKLFRTWNRHALRAVGNAVVPQVVESIGRIIVLESRIPR